MRKFKYEQIDLLSEDDTKEILPPHLALGSDVINQQTGEVLASRDNVFFAMDRVGTVNHYSENEGTPLITDFSKARDLKHRALALVGGSHASALFNDEHLDPDDDEDLNDAHSRPDSSETDDFNEAMASSPYFVNPHSGKARYEEELLKDGEDIKDLRRFIELKDVFADVFGSEKNYETLMKATPEQLKSFIDSIADGKETPPITPPSDAPSE